MTNYNKATLAATFSQGDIPQGSDFSNLIYSQVNLVETVTQQMAGPLQTTKLVTALVSAPQINITGNLSVVSAVSANSVFASLGSFFAVQASFGQFATIVSAASLNVTGDVSAATGTVYASAVRSPGGVFGGSAIVSAAGIAQGTAAPLINFINHGKGVVDGTSTGYAIPANKIGWFQFLYNEGVSANLWPPTGGSINGLAANIPFPLVASASVTIFHIAASAYGVK